LVQGRKTKEEKPKKKIKWDYEQGLGFYRFCVIKLTKEYDKEEARFQEMRY
jgi:hypothetical protein